MQRGTNPQRPAIRCKTHRRSPENQPGRGVLPVGATDRKRGSLRIDVYPIARQPRKEVCAVRLNFELGRFSQSWARRLPKGADKARRLRAQLPRGHSAGVRIATQQGTAQTRRGSTYVDFWKKLWIARL